MNDSMYFSQIQEIELKLAKITSSISKQYPKPLNSKEEKKKFFEHLHENKVYNPQIRYESRDIPESIFSQLEELKTSISLKNDKYNIKKLLIQKIDERISMLKAYKYWGDIKSTQYSIKSKGSPNIDEFNKAVEFIKSYRRSKIKFKRVTPQKVGEELQKEVLRLTNQNIEVIFKPLANKILIRAKHGQIIINPEESFRSIDIERLKVHEIQTHYMRYFNSKKIPIEMFHTGTSNYILTEEGLAVYMEYSHDVLSQAQLFIYAGRTVATYLCTQMSFYELFEYLHNLGFKQEDAYKITFRAKRNLNDTSQLGGYTKDYVYFVGFYKVKEHLEKHPENLEKLFLGKIKIEDLELLHEFISKFQREEIKFNN